tara:strand:- start:8 stop:736 length:729 start_codon:yes stop_codon:yes gene_type:complete
MRFIARLDIKNNFVIKGINFEGLRKIGDPNILAHKYYMDGADEIIYIDTVASLYDRGSISKFLKVATKNIFIPITVGGGIRNIKGSDKLLKNGADKIAVNTALFKNKKLSKELVDKYGSQSVVLSIQAKKVSENCWEAYINYGRDKTNMSVLEWVKKNSLNNFGEILLTSIDAEGLSSGFDINLYKCIAKHVKIPLIASGGFGKVQHIKELKKYVNIDAVSISSAVHYNKIDFKRIKKEIDF